MLPENVVPIDTCTCCAWQPDESFPDDWIAFTPWRQHLLCRDCLAVMVEYNEQIAREEDDGMPAEIRIVCDNDGNIIFAYDVASNMPADENEVIVVDDSTDDEGEEGEDEDNESDGDSVRTVGLF